MIEVGKTYRLHNDEKRHRPLLLQYEGRWVTVTAMNDDYVTIRPVDDPWARYSCQHSELVEDSTTEG